MKATSLFLLSFFMLICTYSNGQSITGKWKFANSDEIVEFTKEGLFKVSIQDGGETYGIYELKNNALSLSFLEYDFKFTFPIHKIGTREFILIDPENGNPLVYSFWEITKSQRMR